MMIGTVAPGVKVRDLEGDSLARNEPQEAAPRQSSRPELHRLNENSTDKLNNQVISRVTRRVLIFVLWIPRRNLTSLLWKHFELLRRSTRRALTFPRRMPLPATTQDAFNDVGLDGQ